MQMATRKRLLFPMAAAAASLIALCASPASAATVTINVGNQAIPSGAGCVYVEDTSTSSVVGPVTFTVGGTATINNVNVQALDYVQFEWHKPGSDCSGAYIEVDTHRAPSNLPSVWNIN